MPPKVAPQAADSSRADPQDSGKKTAPKPLLTEKEIDDASSLPVDCGEPHRPYNYWHIYFKENRASGAAEYGICTIGGVAMAMREFLGCDVKGWKLTDDQLLAIREAYKVQDSPQVKTHGLWWPCPVQADNLIGYTFDVHSVLSEHPDWRSKFPINAVKYDPYGVPWPVPNEEPRSTDETSTAE